MSTAQPCPCGLVHEPGRIYYVTLRRGTRTAFLLGPYDTHQGALANVARGSTLALDRDLWSSFDAIGTASIRADGRKPITVFGT